MAKKPKILERLIRQLKAKGFKIGAATAIAQKQLAKNGVLKKGSRKLTKKGQTRNKMTAASRAKSRAAKQNGGRPSDFTYNPRTNSARRKRKK